jgi:hypothetical protein
MTVQQPQPHSEGFETRKQQQHGNKELPSFEALLEPLERRVGRRLGGPGRERCRRAYEHSPQVFMQLTHEALTRARNSPLGFLCRLVDDGDHLLSATPKPLPEDARWQLPDLAAVCPGCEVGGGRHADGCPYEHD